MRTNLLNRYLFSTFWGVFFPLFFSLFMIASVISFIRLSSMTSVVKISSTEMLLLYLAQTPMLVLYTLPIVFFASLVVSFARLSSDLELIVVFSLKANLFRLIRPFFLLAFVLAITLLVLGLVLNPKANYMQQALLLSKQDEIQVNIRASEFGQKFGDWLLFVGEKPDKDSYKDMVLFQRSKKKINNYISVVDENKGSFFVSAKEAKIENIDNLLTLELKDGSSYEIYSDKINQINYDRMKINESGKLRNLEFGGVADHWQKMSESRSIKRDFIWTILVAVFILISTPAAALGIYHPRFGKNRAGLLSFILVVLYYVPIMTLVSKHIAFAFLTPLLWVGAIFLLFRYRLKTF